MNNTPREFQIFVKPAGASCNLSCAYCYYLRKEALYPTGESFRMPDDLLEEYIKQQIQAASGPEISFSWHGGEPTILGLDYFHKIVALQRKYLRPGRRIRNGMQTNGYLLDEDWCRFLASENFGVGLSLDGPSEMHDRYRLTRGGRATHRQVTLACKLLRRFRVPYDLLCVVHNHNVQYPVQVYRFFREIGATYISFLPVVEPRPDMPQGVSAHTVAPEAYGSFLCAIFDEWVRQDVGRIRVQIFEEAVRPARGLEHSLCIYREICGDIPVLEHNGDLYSCDHFVDAAHLLGNICETELQQLLDSPQQRAFGHAKKESLPLYCRECDYKPMCNGGCPKDRILRTPDGEAGLNYLCTGLQQFFAHSLPYLIRLASLEGAQVPQASFSQLARRTVSGRYPQAGRNERCPCGSGLKYKNCCLMKIS